MVAEHKPTFINKYLGVMGKDVFGLVESGLSTEYLDFDVSTTTSNRDEIVIDTVIKSIDGVFGGTHVHEALIQGSLNDGVEYSLMQTITSMSFTSPNLVQRQIITFPWTPKFRVRMKDFATEQAIFYVTVLV